MCGDGPKRMCDMVTPPPLCESYAKWPCPKRSVLDEIVLIAALLAPTVPSVPSPQKRHCLVPGGIVSTSAPTGSEVCVTSSLMPTTKLCLGCFALRFSKVAITCLGVNSFDARPYCPPTMFLRASPAAKAYEADTSRKRGMPTAPSSRVRSRTVMSLTLSGTAARKASASHGRYSRTLRRPVRSPLAFRWSTASCTVDVAEPMATTTRSASGWPAGSGKRRTEAW